ncbi:phage antirepressor KilAC domain-containing protein [Lactococcus lactis]|jgi:anti-repressor protein|uniref:Phage antirepressor KilAC domain-containing protein n=2 Tax=Lactococcus lactis TaxID=1358 RepID=A0AAW7JCJ7_9LACT|nr:phage antirepressor KilAC domain-containing protein [Lactococcus lactis]KST88041.1 Phage antirepressor protein [Lactococcus lactis subsp. lactis]MBU3885678.1 phage antirepressor KilAC domain-containing protein [Lactococcus lactis]MBU7533556.1 phage antirepressor KilAC domain-containing protein [Lactococcus lactis]MCT0077283.1 phage repressor protein/antirepressor Ant [Lactococcus lactis subsp. lactis]MCT3120342.1 phage repressor protein/antirepressor Ant [Lactococcus lactis]
MNELQNFTNGIFNLDVKVEGEEVLFSAEQVAKSLGLTQKQNKSGKIYESIRWETINKYLPQLSGEIEKGSFISEPMVYKLAFKANNAVSEKFTDWLAVEVLPTIRKHGAYMTDAKAQDVISGNGLADLLLQAGNQIKQLELEKSQMKPKALFADSVSASENTILIRDLAKILKQNGIDIGEKRLFTWLRDNGYLVKKIGSDYNSPTQRSMNLGILEFTENTHVHNSGKITVTKTPKVTGKGQIYFVNKFLQDLAS